MQEHHNQIQEIPQRHRRPKISNRCNRLFARANRSKSVGNGEQKPWPPRPIDDAVDPTARNALVANDGAGQRPNYRAGSIRVAAAVQNRR